MVKGLRKLDRKLRRIVPLVERAVMPVLESNAADLANAQRQFVPEGESKNLRQSIRWNRVPGRIAVENRAGGPLTMRRVRKGLKAQDSVSFFGIAGSSSAGDDDYDYALAQEFGTVHQRAQPFFFPPYRLRKARYKRRVSKAVKQALQELRR